MYRGEGGGVARSVSFLGRATGYDTAGEEIRYGGGRLAIHYACALRRLRHRTPPRPHHSTAPGTAAPRNWEYSTATSPPAPRRGRACRRLCA